MKLAYSEKANATVWTEFGKDEALKLAQVPQSLMLTPTSIAAPCTLESQIIAANLKLPAYSPILTKDYDWPSDWRAIPKPFAHQKEMAAFLTLHHRAHNLAEIGTGKTMGVLWASDYLKRKRHIRRVLVVGPLSTVQSVWGNHIGQHLAGLRTYSVVVDTKDKRLKALDRDVDYYIMNNEAMDLAYVKAALNERQDIDLVVIDESDRYRNRTTERYKSMSKYIGQRALWMNTGTPTPQAPTDAWAQQALIAKPTQTFRSFQEETMLKVSNFKWVRKHKAEESVARLLTPAIRFLRDECIDLPPTQVISRQCEMTPAQVTAIRALKTQLRLEFPNGTAVNAVNEAVLRSKVLQVLAGAVYDAQHDAHKIDAGPRVQMCKDIITSSERATIVFTHLTSIATMLSREMEGARLVTGATSFKERTGIFNAFQARELPVIVADPRCMSHGLTLTAADKIIWYSPSDSSGTYVQANGRITRPGQDAHTLIYQLWVDRLELQIFGRLQSNEGFQGLVMKWLDED